MVAFARRLTGLILALVMAAGLPVAAARAGCVCDHAHSRAAATPEPADECPMHHHGARPAHETPPPASAAGSMRCACAGQAQDLINQATVVGVLPVTIAVDAPVFATPSATRVAEAVLSLAAAPPAPPPRA